MSCSQVIRATCAKYVSSGEGFKCRLTVRNQTKSIHLALFPCDIIHECFFFHPDPTSITSLSQLFSLSSDSATCLRSASFCRVPCQQSPTKKSNPLPLLMGTDTALIITVPRRRLQDVTNRRLTPHVRPVNYSIWAEHYQNWSHQITWLHSTSNYSVLVRLSLRHFHLGGTWNISFVLGANWLVVRNLCMGTCL